MSRSVPTRSASLGSSTVFGLLGAGALAAAMVWVTWLVQRPAFLSYDPASRADVRTAGLAIGVGLLAVGATAAAAHAGRGGGEVLAAAGIGLCVLAGVARRPGLSPAVLAAVDAIWLAAPVALVWLLTPAEQRSSTGVRGAAFVGGSAGVTVVLAWGSGFAAIIGPSPASMPSITTGARIALAVHAIVVVVVLLTAFRRHGGDPLERTWPVLGAAALWTPVLVAERVVHLLPVRWLRDPYRLTYRPWATVVVVSLPLLGGGAVLAALAWTLARQRPRHRLGAVAVIAADDPLSRVRRDLASWTGDPTLRLAYADGSGRFLAPDGASLEPSGRPDRAATVLLRAGRPIGLIEHDLALAGAGDTLAAAAELAGVALDANRYLGVGEARLADAQQLAHRLLDVDGSTRRDLLGALEDGPLRRLRSAAEALAYGSSVAEVLGPIQEATAAVRRLSHGLAPPELTTDGLFAALPDRRGVPTRRLPPAVEITLHLLARDDPSAVFEDRGTIVSVRRATEDIPDAVRDRIAVLGGVVRERTVELPVDVDGEAGPDA